LNRGELLGETKKPYTGLFECIQRIAAEEGVGALWDGCLASLILVSNPTIQFVTYDTLKNIAVKRKGRQTLSNLEYFILGAIAKAVATIITYPLQGI